MRIIASALALARRLAVDRRGATAIEYGLIAALIAVAAIVAIKGLGVSSAGMWGNVSTSVKEAM